MLDIFVDIRPGGIIYMYSQMSTASRVIMMIDSASSLRHTESLFTLWSLVMTNSLPNGLMKEQKTMSTTHGHEDTEPPPI